MIGYVYTIPGSAWVVQETDKVLGEGWVLLHRQGTNGAMWYDRRIERADTIRRHRDGQ